MSSEILTRFDDLNTWRQGDQRAPHKPLLVLYALGRWQQSKAEVTFKEAEPELTALLREFGPPRKSDHPEQPFWRLQRDGVWTVQARQPAAEDRGRHPQGERALVPGTLRRLLPMCRRR